MRGIASRTKKMTCVAAAKKSLSDKDSIWGNTSLTSHALLVLYLTQNKDSWQTRGGNWLNNSGWLESAEISPQNPIHFFPLWTFQFFSFAASLYHWHISSTITHYLLVSLICLRFYSPPIKFTHFVLVPAQFIFPHGWECATAIQYVILSHKNRGNKWQWTHRLLCLLSFLTLSKVTLCHHVDLK